MSLETQPAQDLATFFDERGDASAIVHFHEGLDLWCGKQFEEVGALSVEQQEIPKVIAIGKKYGLEFLPPPNSQTHGPLQTIIPHSL